VVSEKDDSELNVEHFDPDFIFENEHTSSEEEEQDEQPFNKSLLETPQLEKNVKCTKCSKTCFNEKKLQVHFGYQHHPTECEKCGKTFIGRRRLKYHLRHVHPEKGRFPCSFCGEAFSTAYLLSRHKVKFHGNNEFKCPHCPASFKLKTFLENHVAYTHNSHSLPCIHCGKRFKAKTYLRTHIRTQHPDEISKTFDKPDTNDAVERKFHCPQCNASFKDKANLGEESSPSEKSPVSSLQKHVQEHG